MELRVFEDNEGTIAVVERGYSPALRHLVKTHKVSVDLLHRVFYELELGELEHVETGKQAADVFTKAVSVMGWPAALKMLHIARSERGRL